MTERNPIIIPKAGSSQRLCAKCGSPRWSGRNIQGAVTFTCDNCKFQWYGGLPQVAQDPTIPYPPDSEPTVQFVENSKMESGVEEIRKRVDLKTDFRKGAPVPNEEDQ